MLHRDNIRCHQPFDHLGSDECIIKFNRTLRIYNIKLIGGNSKTNSTNSEADTCPVWHRGEHSVILYNEEGIIGEFVNLFLYVSVGPSGHR